MGTVYASDLDVQWTVPRDCPDREAFREGLSRRVGREVAFGSDAELGVTGTILPHGSGYELDLETRSPEGTEQRTLQARSCSELARASLLIAALLLSDAPAAPHGAAPPADAVPGARDWYVFARARVIGDLGSLGSASLGPGLGIGVGWHRTWIELGGMMLPPSDLHVNGLGHTPGTLQLMAASAAVCQEFGGGPTLAPCVQLEAGSLRGRGRELERANSARTTWLAAGAGVRGGVRLFDGIYCFADLRAGVPLVRPRFGVHGLGAVHEVPPIVGRLELSLEGRL